MSLCGLSSHGTRVTLRNETDLCVCMYTGACVYVHVYMYMCVCRYMCVCMCVVNLHVCMCIYMYVKPTYACVSDPGPCAVYTNIPPQNYVLSPQDTRFLKEGDFAMDARLLAPRKA